MSMKTQMPFIKDGQIEWRDIRLISVQFKDLQSFFRSFGQPSFDSAMLGVLVKDDAPVWSFAVGDQAVPEADTFDVSPAVSGDYEMFEKWLNDANDGKTEFNIEDYPGLVAKPQVWLNGRSLDMDVEQLCGLCNPERPLSFATHYLEDHPRIYRSKSGVETAVTRMSAFHGIGYRKLDRLDFNVGNNCIVSFVRSAAAPGNEGREDLLKQHVDVAVNGEVWRRTIVGDDGRAYTIGPEMDRRYDQILDDVRSRTQPFYAIITRPDTEIRYDECMERYNREHKAKPRFNEVHVNGDSVLTARDNHGEFERYINFGGFYIADGDSVVLSRGGDPSKGRIRTMRVCCSPELPSGEKHDAKVAFYNIMQTCGFDTIKPEKYDYICTDDMRHSPPAACKCLIKHGPAVAVSSVEIGCDPYLLADNLGGDIIGKGSLKREYVKEKYASAAISIDRLAPEASIAVEGAQYDSGMKELLEGIRKHFRADDVEHFEPESDPDEYY